MLETLADGCGCAGYVLQLQHQHILNQPQPETHSAAWFLLAAVACAPAPDSYLEAHTRDITDSVSATTETCNEDLILQVHSRTDHRAHGSDQHSYQPWLCPFHPCACVIKLGPLDCLQVCCAVAMQSLLCPR
jgi:hypothetical protein